MKHEHQRANLYGFDSADAKKKGLHIGTADAVVDGYDTKGHPVKFILRIHEGVLNPSSPTTLISENQVQEKEHIEDSVCKCHVKDLDGNYGTQQIILHTPESGNFFVPLVQQGVGAHDILA